MRNLRQRRTKQLDLLLSILENADRPLTRNELWETARRTLPSIGFATVSRTVNSLLAESHLVRLQYPGQPDRYEITASEEHPHFICNQCNRTFDLDIPVPKLPKPDLQGFSISGYEVLFFGICEQCR